MNAQPTPWTAIAGAKDMPGDRRTIVDAEGVRVAVCTSAEAAARIIAAVNATAEVAHG